MSFALGVLQLEEALKEPGCPVCRLGHQAAVRSINAFFWESVNDPGIRKRIIASYGFCSDHAALIFEPEILNSAPILGINIIYEQLVQAVCKQLRALQRRKKTIMKFKRWFYWVRSELGVSLPARILPATGICPVCELVNQVSLNALATLFIEIENQTNNIFGIYQASSGLCFSHLRLALEQYGKKYSLAAQAVLEDTITRLNQQQGLMGEFIRKSNWEYHIEELTSEEGRAWKKALAFFTGIER